MFGRRCGHGPDPRLEAHARQDLQRANRLMEIGDFDNAAILYEKLARKVHDIERPRQAAHLYVQAARARILAGQVKPGLDILEQGLSIFAQAGLWEAFDRVGNRAVDELRQHEPAAGCAGSRPMDGILWQNRPPSSTPEEVKEHPHRVHCRSNVLLVALPFVQMRWSGSMRITLRVTTAAVHWLLNDRRMQHHRYVPLLTESEISRRLAAAPLSPAEEDYSASWLPVRRGPQRC